MSKLLDNPKSVLKDVQSSKIRRDSGVGVVKDQGLYPILRKIHGVLILLNLAIRKTPVWLSHQSGWTEGFRINS